MKSLSDLYKKEGAAAAPSASPLDVASVEKAPEPSAAQAPILEVPPGLPQEYVDVNLKNQPLPQVVDPQALAQQEQARELNVRIVPGGESLCNADNIAFVPGYESKLVKDRIAQGPHVFVSRAQREAFENGLQEEKKKAPPPEPIAHPDTLRPGTHIKGEHRPYRPI